jgi:hypothetical protein
MKSVIIAAIFLTATSAHAEMSERPLALTPREHSAMAHEPVPSPPPRPRKR